jgi:molybdopterin molybdotransferase
MPEFFNVLPPDDARALLLSHVSAGNDIESLATQQALGRVTAEAILAPHALPSFRRSTMDGYAVRAADTHGASSSLPAFLSVIGEVEMGHSAEVELETGQVAIVHTGGMIPASADAVVQIEHTQYAGQDLADDLPFEIEVFRAAGAGQNILQIGEDVKPGAEVMPAGRLLRPQDLGGLLALGVTQVNVTARPRVAIMATGDEVVSPSETPEPGQIRDINSYTVAGQVQQAGGVAVLIGIVPDDFETLLNVAASAIAANDMLVMSAGSSVSVRDMTVEVINQLGEPGVLFHGVATRPGKPTIAGAVDNKPVLGLPGNPVSAMVQFAMFGAPAIRRLQGLHMATRQGMVWARISQNLASETGREDYVPAKLRETVEGLVAIPVFGKSNLIYTLVNADGLLKVPLNKGGLVADEWVEVHLF